MKTYLFPLVPAMAVAALLSSPVIAAPSALPLDATTPIYTDTDQPNLAPIEGAVGQTDAVSPNDASPTGAVKNMAPVRGNPARLELEVANPGNSASGLTIPGASSGSSLGSGSNSTLTPLKKAEDKDLDLPD